MYSATVNDQVTHSSAVEGSDEQRKEMYREVHRLSSGIGDALMYRKYGRVSCSARKQAIR